MRQTSLNKTVLGLDLGSNSLGWALLEFEGNKPKAIIAIACERDLLSGMVDIFPCPVWGIVNKRPNGPCFNTSVEINEVKEALNKLLVE